jgi:hypothetical protein
MEISHMCDDALMLVLVQCFEILISTQISHRGSQKYDSEPCYMDRAGPIKIFSRNQFRYVSKRFYALVERLYKSKRHGRISFNIPCIFMSAHMFIQCTVYSDWKCSSDNISRRYNGMWFGDPFELETYRVYRTTRHVFVGTNSCPYGDEHPNSTLYCIEPISSSISTIVPGNRADDRDPLYNVTLIFRPYLNVRRTYMVKRDRRVPIPFKYEIPHDRNVRDALTGVNFQSIINDRLADEFYFRTDRPMTASSRLESVLEYYDYYSEMPPSKSLLWNYISLEKLSDYIGHKSLLTVDIG